MKPFAIRRLAALATLFLTLTAASGAASSPRTDDLSEPPVATDRIFYSYADKIDFDLFRYLADRAPHLLPYEETLSHWCGLTTISPRIALALIERQSGLVTGDPPDLTRLSRPLGHLSEAESFGAQVEDVLGRLSSEVYARLPDGDAGAPGAGRAAAAEALAALLVPEGTVSGASDRVLRSIAEVHERLFPDRPPLSRPLQAISTTRAAPSNDLLLPWPVGESRIFSGTHPRGGLNPDSPHSAIDFYPPFFPPCLVCEEGTTLVASHAGRVKKHSSCFLEILGAGGWSTVYYHLDDIQVEEGQEVAQGQPVAAYALDREQALCDGGSWGSPHVHFALGRNGVDVSLDGSELSGWRVHPGRYPFDSDCDHFWLQEGERRVCYREPLLNQGFRRRLTVLKTGDGAGTVTTSGGGIDCGSRCGASFRLGETVVLTATPAPGSRLVEIRGAGCSGTDSCTLEIASDDTVTAEFAAAPPALGLSGFRVRAWFDLGGEPVEGTVEPDCVAETLCISGAVPGRAEVFVRMVGPKPNDFLWPTLVKLSPSPIEVEIERLDDGETRRYELPGSAPGGRWLLLDGLTDKEGFAADGAAPGVAPLERWGADPVVHTIGSATAEPPPGPWIESPSLPGFRVKARITSGTFESAGTAVPECVDETLCLAGALPDRPEIFVRVVGPRPNDRLWPIVTKFSTSRVEVWIEQLDTGATRHYDLAPAVPGERFITLEGLADRLGFDP